MKLVYVHILNGQPVRILKKITGKEDFEYKQIPRADAVSAIREQVYLRAAGRCEFGGEIITRNFHMHEKISRGDGGEISVQNCFALCAKCHLQMEHGNRRPKFGKK